MDNQIIDDLGVLWKDLKSQLADPLNGLALFANQARENLLAIKAGQPLMGHLLPYIRHDQAKEYEVEAHAVNGWLDILPNFQAEKADIASSTEMP